MTDNQDLLGKYTAIISFPETSGSRHDAIRARLVDLGFYLGLGDSEGFMEFDIRKIPQHDTKPHKNLADTVELTSEELSRLSK